MIIYASIGLSSITGPLLHRAILAATAVLFAVGAAVASSPVSYPDGRPTASMRLDAEDEGVVLRRGNGPNDCDIYCVREAIVCEDEGVYYLHYDGAGPKGWLACLATSSDLRSWHRHGPVLDLGEQGQMDAAAATSPWVIREGPWWHMFYLGTPNASPPPERVPRFPYLTLKARSQSLHGPWEKQYEVVPFSTKPNTYYSATASPGHVIRYLGEYLMFFSGSTPYPKVKRTLGIARTRNLNGPWVVQDQPLVPLDEQIENSSVYFEPANKTWFLFTNHIGINDQEQEYTDAIWVYWSRDPLSWSASRKAVVLDGSNCLWSKRCIGMPSVVPVGARLAILYDAPGGESLDHVNRDIGLAWLRLPLRVPTDHSQEVSGTAE